MSEARLVTRCPYRAGWCEKDADHDGSHYTTYRDGEVWTLPAAAPAESVEQRVRRLDRGPVPPTIAAAPAEGLREALERLVIAIYDYEDDPRSLTPIYKARDEARAVLDQPAAAPAEGLPWTLLRALVGASDADLSCHGCGVYRRGLPSDKVHHGDGCKVQQARADLARHESAGSE